MCSIESESVFEWWLLREEWFDHPTSSCANQAIESFSPNEQRRLAWLYHESLDMMKWKCRKHEKAARKRGRTKAKKRNKKTNGPQDHDTRPQLSIIEYIDRATKEKHISFAQDK